MKKNKFIIIAAIIITASLITVFVHKNNKPVNECYPTEAPCRATLEAVKVK